MNSLDLFLETFVSRRNDFALQRTDGGYVRAGRAICPHEVHRHLSGAQTIGSYVIDEHGCCRYAVFDANSEDRLHVLHGVQSQLAAEGIASYLELSRRGGHLWVFLATPTRASTVRAWLLPFCPPAVVGSGAHGVPAMARASGRYPAPPGAAYPYPGPPGYPPPGGSPNPIALPLDLPAADPARSSQIFKLPPQDTAADPIRSRARGKFPIGMVVIGFLALLLLGILGYAGYRTFLVKPQPLEPFTNTLGMKMLKIEGGTFRMGSPDDEPGRAKEDEGPVHEVTIRGPFLIAATEVTHGQFVKVMGTSPSRSGGRAANAAELPVEKVTYDEGADDKHTEIHQIVADDEMVGCICTVSATHTGRYFDVEPTGTRLVVHEMMFNRVRDGLVATTWAMTAGPGFYEQLTGRQAPEVVDNLG